MYTASGTFYYTYPTKTFFSYTFTTADEVVDWLKRIREAALHSWYHTDVTIMDEFTGKVIIGAI